METSELPSDIKKCLNEIIKCHKNSEIITFNYSPNNKSFNKLMVKDIENIQYVEKKGKKYYFMLSIADNSGWRDCDVRYTYIPIPHKPFYSHDEVLALLRRQNDERIGVEPFFIKRHESWVKKVLNLDKL